MGLADRPLALTLGDPAGIGPDITLLAWEARQREAIPPFVLLGDADVVAARARALGLEVPIGRLDDASEAPAVFRDALPVLPVRVGGQVVAGHPSQAAMPAVRESIERAVALTRQGVARAVVTNPIAKAVLYGAGFAFPGHTEYLAALASTAAKPLHPVMMLVGPQLKVVPVTIHVPLKEVPRLLTSELILRTIEITAEGLTRYFGIERPRLAVSGLNPHAGEDGGLGREEIEIIAPAIAAARAKGLDVTGPHPADTLFHAGRAGALRRRDLHVSRPGARAVEDARFRGRRQCHPRAAFRANLARSWHRFQPRRHRQSEPTQPDRGAALGGGDVRPRRG